MMDDATARALAALQIGAPLWVPWVALIVAAVWASHSFPLVRGRLIARVAIHACALVAVGMTSVLAVRLIQGAPAFPAVQGASPGDTSARATSSSARVPLGGRRPGGPPAAVYLASHVVVYALAAAVAHAVTGARRAREREHRALAAEARLARVLPLGEF